jgi:hypothetical protein
MGTRLNRGHSNPADAACKPHPPDPTVGFSGYSASTGSDNDARTDRVAAMMCSREATVSS